MSRKVIVEMPEELVDTLQKLYEGKAEQEISRELLKVIKDFTESRLRRMSDPIFAPIATRGSGLSDASEHHDKYLYGK
ncbi:MAG: hypothetical protein AAGB97_09215 [Dehalococcoidia bacterium]